MKKENITIELTPLMASVMSRMLSEEQDLQLELIDKDKREGRPSAAIETREKIYRQLQELRDDIYEKAGYYYYQ